MATGGVYRRVTCLLEMITTSKTSIYLEEIGLLMPGCTGGPEVLGRGTADEKCHRREGLFSGSRSQRMVDKIGDMAMANESWDCQFIDLNLECYRDVPHTLTGLA
ncbi:hypothetical protein GMDG_07350 [Pseudogymnoascus destructans 20631-21]|uniref:Uncharacterized protein n=1 Tax=Pseudogymnoascus destructans (strain ATCC MYA-4855 / 20631-21) TaxID=658429 RepID=L8FWU3_PSED2|nr:hypothetical protein GMDG_07350 [Pseudogymnoascus destructans 20631-21]